MPECEGHSGRAWCGQCYSNVRGRSAFKHHRMYRPKREDVLMGSHLQAKPPKGPPPQASAAPADDAFQKGFPLTYDFLTMLSYGDGTSRQLATLTFFVDGGIWKLWLNDRDNQRSLCVSAQGVQEAFRKLEAALGTASPEWRQARPQGGRKGR